MINLSSQKETCNCDDQSEGPDSEPESVRGLRLSRHPHVDDSVVERHGDSVVAEATREREIVFPPVLEDLKLRRGDRLRIVDDHPLDPLEAGRCGEGALVVVDGVLREAADECLEVEGWHGNFRGCSCVCNRRKAA